MLKKKQNLVCVSDGDFRAGMGSDGDFRAGTGSDGDFQAGTGSDGDFQAWVVLRLFSLGQPDWDFAHFHFAHFPPGLRVSASANLVCKSTSDCEQKRYKKTS